MNTVPTDRTAAPSERQAWWNGYAAAVEDWTGHGTGRIVHLEAPVAVGSVPCSGDPSASAVVSIGLDAEVLVVGAENGLTAQSARELAGMLVRAAALIERGATPA